MFCTIITLTHLSRHFVSTNPSFSMRWSLTHKFRWHPQDGFFFLRISPPVGPSGSLPCLDLVFSVDGRIRSLPNAFVLSTFLQNFFSSPWPPDAFLRLFPRRTSNVLTSLLLGPPGFWSEPPFFLCLCRFLCLPCPPLHHVAVSLRWLLEFSTLLPRATF